MNPVSSPPTTAVLADEVAGRVREVRDRIREAQARAGRDGPVHLIAVTKTLGVDAVRAAFAAGVHDVGENRVQEAEVKRAEVTLPVRWHLIGHLQRNKAEQAVHFDLVHSLDSERLAAALSIAATSAERVVDVLVQVNVSGEKSKFGLAPSALPALSELLHGYAGLRVRGVMTMAPYDASESVLRRVFSGARACAEQLRASGHPADCCSMGMSGDFEVAVEEGATHVRLGTYLFGARAA